MSFDIAEAKRRLPLPRLLERLGLGEHAKARARCPWPQYHKHGDKNPSFGIFGRPDGSWGWKCFVCGSGDEITLLERHERLSNKDAMARLCELAGLDGSTSGLCSRTANAPKADPKPKVEASGVTPASRKSRLQRRHRGSSAASSRLPSTS